MNKLLQYEKKLTHTKKFEEYFEEYKMSPSYQLTPHRQILLI
jgi:hypothetical protein